MTKPEKWPKTVNNTIQANTENFMAKKLIQRASRLTQGRTTATKIITLMRKESAHRGAITNRVSTTSRGLTGKKDKGTSSSSTSRTSR